MFDYDADVDADDKLIKFFTACVCEVDTLIAKIAAMKRKVRYGSR